MSDGTTGQTLLGPRGLEPEAVAGVLGGRWLRDPAPDVTILGASIDTRELNPGQVFFALRGERSDGHGFVGAAAEGGASVAVVDRAIDPAPAGMGVLLVGDPRGALAALARAYRSAVPGLRVIGVTGSNGKTTTVRMIHAALVAGGVRASRSRKSHNNELGVPLTLLNAAPDDDAVVCEIGMNATGEIATLCGIARPDIGVVTSIGMAHIEALGSVEAIAREKADIVRTLGPGGIGIVCGNSVELDGALAGFDPSRLVRVGEDGRSGLRLDSIAADAGGSACGVVEPDGARTELRTPLPGAHNARNAALAFAVARRLGVSAEDAARGIARAEGPPMRLERSVVETPSGPVHVVNDAYNANPDSVRVTLGLLATGQLDPVGVGPAARRIAVLGEMLELGGHAESAHLEVAQGVALADGISGVALIGAWAERMAAVIESARPGAVLLAEPDPEANWVARAVSGVRSGDIVLLKGSRALRLERLLHGLAGVGAG